MKKGDLLDTSEHVFDCLMKHKQYTDDEEWEAETGIQPNGLYRKLCEFFALFTFLGF